jgi:hypothetical protein
MRARTLGYAAAAGVAAFLLAFVAVAELLAGTVEFSVFVALPVGVVAGVAAAALVLHWTGRDADAGHRRLARALGAFGVGFLAALLAVAGAVGAGVVLGMVAGVAVGAVAAGVTFVRR